jgi:hypothetical protein
VVRRERDGACVAEHEDARPGLHDGVVRARAAGVHRTGGRGRVPERGQRGAQSVVLRSGTEVPRPFLNVLFIDACVLQDVQCALGDDGAVPAPGHEARLEGARHPTGGREHGTFP